MRRWSIVFGMVILSLCLVASCAPAKEVSIKPAEFYKGSTITIVVPGSAGGGNDILARLLAPYLNELTGATVVVENKEELTGLNHVYKVAKPDGLTIGLYAASAIFPNDLLDISGCEYEIEKYEWIGGILELPAAYTCYVSPTGRYQSVKDLQQAKGLKFGGTTPGASSSIAPALAAYTLDLDAKVVTGFKGSAEIVLSVAKGELDGYVSPYGGAKQYMDKGQLKPLFIIDLQRDKALPNLPAVSELVSLTKEKQDLVSTFVAVTPARIVYTTPGVPKDRVEFLRGAFIKAAGNKDFGAAVMKVGTASSIEIITGEEMAKKAKAVKESAATYKDKLTALVAKYRA